AARGRRDAGLRQRRAAAPARLPPAAGPRRAGTAAGRPPWRPRRQGCSDPRLHGGAAVRGPAPGVRRRRHHRRSRVRRGQRARRHQRAGGPAARERRPLRTAGARGGACMDRSPSLSHSTGMPPEASLDLGLIGNGSIAALVDAHARVSWCCIPAFDGDPAFCALLSPRAGGGDYAIELEDFESATQEYVKNTALLRTVLRDRHGGAVEITDFAPRWRQHGRFYRPVMLVRRLRPLSGRPRVRIVLRPLANYGADVPEQTWGSNHVRYLLPGFTLRLASDVPVRLVRESLAFELDGDRHLVLGPDETLTQPVDSFARNAERQTTEYWRDWVRYLSIPLEWQDAVI